MEKNNKNKACELLIPVGGKEQLIAAVENGADGIYLGGQLFNARIKADNFGDEDLREGVIFAHKRGVKVFVTMNTLLTDEQVESALKYGKKIHSMGVDALIIQDLGLGSRLRKELPEMELHLSTQGSVFGVEGVKLAEKLGYKRVVLAREVSLDEIKRIRENTKADLEYFVHGALCFSYSGQCHLSRAFGGRSGNKGLCAQPCRLVYEEGGCGENHSLSPKDLNLIENLGQLIDRGVYSLKVEGRMKSPAYVAVVTGIYRKYIDEYLAYGKYKVSDEDKEKLMQAFNRGGFTQGYIYGDPGEALMADKISKNMGVYLGQVVEDIGRGLVKITVSKKPEMGDLVEFYGKTIHSNKITYLKEVGKSIFIIGDAKDKVAKGDKIYRIISEEQQKEAEKTYKKKDFRKGKYLKTNPVDLTLVFEEGRLTLEGRLDLTGNYVKVNKILEKGPDNTLDNSLGSKTLMTGLSETKLEKIKQALSKMGGTPFHLGNLEICGEAGYNIKLSIINQMRRNLIENLEKDIEDTKPYEVTSPKGDIDISIDYAGEVKNRFLEERSLQVYFYKLDDFYSFNKIEIKEAYVKKLIAILPIADILIKNKYEVEKIEKTIIDKGFDSWIPYITNISKGKEDRIVKENFSMALAVAKNRGIFVGNLQWIESFLKEGIDVYGDYGLNIYNKYTEKVFSSMGLKGWMPSSETYGDENGSYPLMISEHIIESDYIKDRKNQRIELVKRDFSDQMILKIGGNKWFKIGEKTSRYFV